MKFNQKIQTVFLDPSSDAFSVDGDVNVILSPSLYWVKKVSLPVSSMREARQLLASLFEDTLPKEGSFSYSIYKKEDDFYIFAYEDRLILDTLSKKGIMPTHVKNVYFAQSEFDSMKKALRINERQSIYVQDGIVVMVPCCWIEESGEIDVENIKLSEYSIKLKHFSHIVDNKTLYTLLSVLSAFILLYGIEYFIIDHKVQKFNELKDEVFIKNDQKPTMLQNSSILQRYKDIDKREKKLTDAMALILRLELPKTVKIDQLKMDENKLLVKFSGIKSGGEKSIKDMMNSKNVLFESYFKNGNWYVEVRL